MVQEDAWLAVPVPSIPKGVPDPHLLVRRRTCEDVGTHGHRHAAKQRDLVGAAGRVRPLGTGARPRTRRGLRTSLYVTNSAAET